MPGSNRVVSKRELDQLIARINRLRQWAVAATSDISTEEDARCTHLASAASGVSIVLGGTLDLAVTWTTPFPSAVYRTEVIPLFSGGTVAVISQDANGCTVRITAAVLLAVGARVLVLGQS